MGFELGTFGIYSKFILANIYTCTSTYRVGSRDLRERGSGGGAYISTKVLVSGWLITRVCLH